MILFVDGIRKGVHYENVNYWIQDYESAFELLTQLVTDHWTLEHALIVDNGECVVIPVEAFDGQPIKVHIGVLQQEWTQLLLTKPRMSKQSGPPGFRDWLLRLDTYYDHLLLYLEKMILWLESRKLKLATGRNEKLKRFLRTNYDLRLALNRKLYQQTKTNRQKNQQRLLELDKK